VYSYGFKPIAIVNKLKNIFVKHPEILNLRMFLF
jgi:hypothetical protein